MRVPEATREAMLNTNVPEYPMVVEEWPAWTWAHLTPEMTGDIGDLEDRKGLPFWIIHGRLVDLSDLKPTTRAVLHCLGRRMNATGIDKNGQRVGSHRRTWPKLEQLADQSGFNERTIRRATEDAEAEGWLVIVRHRYRYMQNDYILDVPELESCPCRGCAQDPPDPVGAVRRRLPGDRACRTLTEGSLKAQGAPESGWTLCQSDRSQSPIRVDFLSIRPVTESTTSSEVIWGPSSSAPQLRALAPGTRRRLASPATRNPHRQARATPDRCGSQARRKQIEARRNQTPSKCHNPPRNNEGLRVIVAALLEVTR